MSTNNLCGWEQVTQAQPTLLQRQVGQEITQTNWRCREAANAVIPLSIDRLCDWGEQEQPTLLQRQVGRV